MEEKDLLKANIISRIKDISLISFDIKTITEEQNKNFSKDKFVFEQNIELIVDPQLKEISIVLNIKIYSEASKKLLLAELISKGIFEIVNFEDLVKDFNGQVPLFAVALYIGVLVSTSRGFLILKSQGTIIEGALLPIIDTTQFFKKE
jgi:hypothetical protein